MDNSGPATESQNAETITILRDEIALLTQRLEKEKEKYSKLSSNNIAVEQQFKIKNSFKLIEDEGTIAKGNATTTHSP